MRLLAFLAAATIAAGTLLGSGPAANAQAYLAEPPVPAVFVYHGQRYCFAPDGWNGPGWYWCGYAHRPGFGWGGPVGWHGWRAPWHGGGWHPHGWHGGWNPRWGHGPAVVPGGWHPHSWHPHGGRPHGWTPHPHGGPHHGGGHGHRGPHGHHGHRHRH